MSQLPRVHTPGQLLYETIEKSKWNWIISGFLKIEILILIMKRRKTKREYIYAFDPIIKRRVPHVVRGGYAISLVTGNKFKYKRG